MKRYQDVTIKVEGEEENMPTEESVHETQEMVQ